MPAPSRAMPRGGCLMRKGGAMHSALHINITLGACAPALTRGASFSLCARARAGGAPGVLARRRWGERGGRGVGRRRGGAWCRDGAESGEGARALEPLDSARGLRRRGCDVGRRRSVISESCAEDWSNRSFTERSSAASRSASCVPSVIARRPCQSSTARERHTKVAGVRSSLSDDP